MSSAPEHLHYTKTHEWVSVEDDGTVLIGITDHAQHLLGDMVFVELPQVGDVIHAGDEAGVLESVKAAADYYAPISGEIIDVNEQLSDSPGMLNAHPYGDGWLFRLVPSDESELNDLLNASAYDDLVAEEE